MTILNQYNEFVGITWLISGWKKSLMGYSLCWPKQGHAADWDVGLSISHLKRGIQNCSYLTSVSVGSF